MYERKRGFSAAKGNRSVYSPLRKHKASWIASSVTLHFCLSYLFVYKASCTWPTCLISDINEHELQKYRYSSPFPTHSSHVNINDVTMKANLGIFFFFPALIAHILLPPHREVNFGLPSADSIQRLFIHINLWFQTPSEHMLTPLLIDGIYGPYPFGQAHFFAGAFLGHLFFPHMEQTFLPVSLKHRYLHLLFKGPNLPRYSAFVDFFFWKRLHQ